MKNKRMNIEQAFKYCSSISVNSPCFAETQFNMGVLCHNNGHFLQAISFYENAINNRLCLPAIYYNLALCYYELNDIPHAIEYFFKAIEKKKDFKDAILNCCALCLRHGKALHKNQRIDEAIELYLKCLCIAFGPQHIALLQNLAGAYAIKGDITKAIKCTIRSLELDPMQTFPYSLLAKLRKFTDKDKSFVQQMELLLNRYTQKQEDQVLLCWALGKVYDDIKNYNMAFSYYKKANKMDAKKKSFNIEKHIQFKNKMISTFKDQKIRELSCFGNSSSLPLFIVGHNRTGTTLLANKLSMIDNVYSAGELLFFPHCVEGLPDNIPEATQERIQKLAKDYLAMLSNVADNAVYVIDKMPVNFVHIGWILTLFPNAKIIHCKRHPLDICLSNFFTSYEAGNSFSYDLNNMAMYFKVYEQLMQYWYTLFNNNIYTVYYENFISNTEQIGKKLLEWLALRWKDAFLYHHNNKTLVYTSSFSQVRQKIYHTSINRWKHYEHLMEEIKEFLTNDIKKYEKDLLADASKYE
jgi:tetratricopeptide (TPR) repeat protein